MWVVYLEVGVALLLAVFIVWWTWPRKKPDAKKESDADSGGPAQ